jgi:hypothetical protein
MPGWFPMAAWRAFPGDWIQLAAMDGLIKIMFEMCMLLANARHSIDSQTAV